MSAAKIRIEVNGKERVWTEGATLRQLLDALKIDGEGLAVAVNLDVVRRADHVKIRLQDGDKIEIITAVGGG